MELYLLIRMHAAAAGSLAQLAEALTSYQQTLTVD